MPEKSPLALILCAGDFERLHYAFVMAAAAVATGRPVTLFFTMSAVETLRAETPGGEPGWHGLAVGADQIPAADKDATQIKAGLAGFEELLSACVEFGANFQVCEMGLKARDLEVSDLRTDIPVTISGMVGFLAETEGENARTVFI